MKKGIVFIISILILCCLCLFVSCSDESSNDAEATVSNETNNTDNSNSDFTAVQSIEYTSESELNYTYDYITIESLCYINYSTKSVTASEYENAENKINWLSRELRIDRNGKASNGLSIEELKDLSNKSFYYMDGDIFDSSYTYYKVTFTNIIISYVNVKFFDDGFFLVKQQDRYGTMVTTRIKPLFYSVHYFNE